jgi:hypothetical protein
MRFLPRKTVAVALAVTAFAAGMSTASANGWPRPDIACNENNAGTFYDVQDHAQWQRLQIIYYCDGDEWQRCLVCDLSPDRIRYPY